MITRFKKILFFADGAKGELSALRRCYSVARHSGAALVVLGVVDEVSTNDVQLRPAINRIQQSMVDEREAELATLVANIEQGQTSSVAVSVEVVAGKDYVAVIRQALEGSFDIIIKAANATSVLQQALFGGTDMRLIHSAPCPVMILKPSRRKRWRNLLVAVDPRAETMQEAALNDDLLAMGVSIAKSESSKMNLLHVLEQSAAGRKHQVQSEFSELEESLKADAVRKLQLMAEGYEGFALGEHLLTGNPPATISGFVDDNGVDLLIMGSVGRSGMAGILVGNTAEKILRQVNCSVLVMKPGNWQAS